MWLHLAGLRPVRFHTAPDDSLDLSADQPHDSYDMEEYGRVSVDPAPQNFPMSRFLGQSVREAHRIIDHQFEVEVGLWLAFDRGEVCILNMADELVISRPAA
ncbi:hypothetical protein JYK22_16625, partial [Nonomuraea sp. RK-328]|nr:hypothetical protein [Nonomuraea sp. RK-328]